MKVCFQQRYSIVAFIPSKKGDHIHQKKGEEY